MSYGLSAAFALIAGSFGWSVVPLLLVGPALLAAPLALALGARAARAS